MQRLNNLLRIQKQFQSALISMRNGSSSAQVNRIVLPKRINRSPTDILYALSNTVGVDPTAAHYKYHDDPFLIPTSESQKVNYALAQEAGKKAAQWIKEEQRDLFQVLFDYVHLICHVIN